MVLLGCSIFLNPPLSSNIIYGAGISPIGALKPTKNQKARAVYQVGTLLDNFLHIG